MTLHVYWSYNGCIKHACNGKQTCTCCQRGCGIPRKAGNKNSGSASQRLGAQDGRESWLVAPPAACTTGPAAPESGPIPETQMPLPCPHLHFQLSRRVLVTATYLMPSYPPSHPILSTGVVSSSCVVTYIEPCNCFCWLAIFAPGKIVVFFNLDLLAKYFPQHLHDNYVTSFPSQCQRQTIMPTILPQVWL